MFSHTISEQEKRVLLLAPTARDAKVTVSLLTEAGLSCFACSSVEELGQELRRGAATVLLTDTSLFTKDLEGLVAYFENQPSWSDLPVVLLVQPGNPLPSHLQFLRNVTVLERPASTRNVLSAVQAAVRARGRQYQIRSQIGEIRNAREEMEAMADCIPQIAWMADEKGQCFWFNRRWYEYTGKNFDQSKDWGWRDVVDPGRVDAVVEQWKQALRSETFFEMEIPFRGADGQYRMFLSRAQPFQVEAGQAPRWFGTLTDIEELIRLRESRESLLESERAARIEAERSTHLKDEFLATVSHELRTPLTAIVGWAEIIKTAPESADTVMKGIEVIERSARIQTQLIADLLDLSRITSGKMRLELEPVSLAEVTEAALDSVHTLAEAKGIQIHRQLGSSEKNLIGDPGRLQQIVWNLLSNAVKFTPPGGEIHVGIEKRDSQVYLTVCDDGCGISKDFQPFLFERFRQADASATRHHGGLGIGLALVKQLAEMHGGTVSVASDGEGFGSTFTVRLPLTSVAAGAGGSYHSPVVFDRPDLEGVKVLVVDDEPDAREMFRRILIECGAEVCAAGSADEALQTIEAEHPNVILSDIGMPGRDGYDLIRALRASGSTIPAAAVTAFVRSEDRAKSLLAGFQLHLSKPVEPHELLVTVASLAGRT
jgi:PAS domain S-box-containing protein